MRRRCLLSLLTLCLVLVFPFFLSSSVSPSQLSLLLLLFLPVATVALLLLLPAPRLANSSFIRRQEEDKGKDSSGYGSRDSLVSSGREKEEGSHYRRTRSDLSAELLSRANADTTNKEDRKSSWSSKWVLVYLAVYCRPSVAMVDFAGNA